MNGRKNATFQLIIKAIWTFSFCWFQKSAKNKINRPCEGLGIGVTLHAEK